MMRKTIFITAAFALLSACSQESGETSSQSNSSAPATVNGLATAASFESIADDRNRAIAVFAEMGKVIQHPRCVNCHPRGERPMQTEASIPHQPHVVRGDGGIGVSGLRCTACHGADNYANVPGNPAWHLAPAEMAWQDKPLGEICAQLKDPERNGQRTLADIVDHMTNDELVGYGWNPPEHLIPAPGDQAAFGALAQAWVDAGAHCPDAGDA